MSEANLSESFFPLDKTQESDYGISEEDLNLPVTHNMCVVYRFIQQENKFDFDSNKIRTYEVIEGKVDKEKFNYHFDLINNDRNLTPPSAFYKFGITLLAVCMMMSLLLILLLIWAILILDLVILALAIYIMKRSGILIWVWRAQVLDRAWFPGLRKLLIELNEEYSRVGLHWTLDNEGKWLQLGQKEVDHCVFN
ncbi:unnamed protein product [Blepharisma stoltei]|uniref:Caveolin n=1 Tax=Blepharisma stoltei TaxID=1481888 RepID=A0AAU9IVX9_9CILI|nr:unnamed protein product [Blepharisma stoltei]